MKINMDFLTHIIPIKINGIIIISKKLHAKNNIPIKYNKIKLLLIYNQKLLTLKIKITSHQISYLTRKHFFQLQRNRKTF